MCGLFGAISPKWDPSVIRTLAICNRERGTDSLGFFDSTGRMIKGASDPMQVLGQENITRWLEGSKEGTDKNDPSWFIAGHTRLGTRGAANRKNAHPFRYGNIIGSHNGMVTASMDYAVDSMILFDELNQAGGDYQLGLEGIAGYWGLSWYDGTSFYLQVNNADLHITKINDAWYYSSDDEHLIASLGYDIDTYKLKDGETYQFTFVNGEIVFKELELFVSKAVIYTKKYYSHTPCDAVPDCYEWSRSHASSVVKDLPVQEWDSEWRDSWEDYCNEEKHIVGT